MTLNLSGFPSTASRIRAATNLTPPIQWQPIFINSNTGTEGVWQFTGTNAVDYPERFYVFSTP